MAMKRKVALLLAYLFLASVCTAAYAGQVGPGLRLLKGPYLQNVTLTSIVVMWETSQPSDSRVDFRPLERTPTTFVIPPRPRSIR